MNIKYLAIEADDAVHKRESEFWLSRNISSVRVTHMSDGIKEAATNQFLYIGINADNINYQPKLKLLREVTNDPIFIATSTHSVQEQSVANNLGADLFAPNGNTPQENFNAVMAKIKRLDERVRQRKSPVKILLHDNVLVAPQFRQVYIEESEVTLTKTEFDILCYLLQSRGRVLTFQQIYRYIWEDEYDKSINDIVRNHIKKLKQNCTLTAIS